MLNISDNRITDKVRLEDSESCKHIIQIDAARTLARIMLGAFAVLFVGLFLPWTQNIRARGMVTSIDPSQRPQQVNSIIAGRIERWYVKEGDHVQIGDTLAFISEVKDAYFDPQLLQRAGEQLNAAQSSVGSYDDKVRAIEQQMAAQRNLQEARTAQAKNRLEQAGFRVTTDSADVEAAKLALSVAEQQYKRQKELFDKGLKSLTELETRDIALRQAQARMVAADNRLAASRNERINARTELDALRSDLADKLSKAESDRQSAITARLDAEAKTAKLRNDLANYNIRRGMYHILAPQSGYITRALRTGIGETVKEGEELLTIVPDHGDLAVEVYVNPIDIPLIHSGEKVRLFFDGWPALVFSGWPGISFGTFGGIVVNYDRVISPNGKFRLLVAPDPDDHPWPDAVQQGSGAVGMALLNTVPVWYELWRQINGFPPDFYTPTQNSDEKSDKK